MVSICFFKDPSERRWEVILPGGIHFRLRFVGVYLGFILRTLQCIAAHLKHTGAIIEDSVQLAIGASVHGFKCRVHVYRSQIEIVILSIIDHQKVRKSGRVGKVTGRSFGGGQRKGTEIVPPDIGGLRIHCGDVLGSGIVSLVLYFDNTGHMQTPFGCMGAGLFIIVPYYKDSMMTKFSVRCPRKNRLRIL